MKTKKQVIKDNEEYKSLINAVISNIGMDSVDDVNSHGIDGGYSGFIYYSDTHKFAIKHQKAIVSMLEQQAKYLGSYDSWDDSGPDVVEMVSGFGYFRNNPMDADDKKDLYRYLSGCKPEQGTITNLMAWYAAEEVCRMFDE